MAVYAIGDIQGCFSELEKLLKKIHFNPQTDQLWFVGDLVNRGPRSLDTLLFIKSLHNSAHCVLGNHDIHLIACYTGAQKCKPKSSLNQILEHAEVDNIIDWLRKRPFVHHDAELTWTMVHAGLLPEWDLTATLYYAKELETQLQGEHYVDLINNIYGEQPNQWHESLSHYDRWRIIINAFTRLRFLDQHGCIDFDYKGPLGKQPKHLHAWFDVPRKSQDMNIVFGHWSALGLKKTPNLLGIDTGCLWGGQLTAARIDCQPAEIYTLDCTAKRKINAGGQIS